MIRADLPPAAVAAASSGGSVRIPVITLGVLCFGILIAIPRPVPSGPAPAGGAADKVVRADTELDIGNLDASTLKDAYHALDLGIRWLETNQHEDGSWSQAQFPAMTALAVSAICSDPRRSPGALPPSAEKGLSFLITCVRPDGGIYVPADEGGGLPLYNTAISMMALAIADPDRYASTIESARAFVVHSQHLGGDVYNGGFGYEAENDRLYADLSNTYMALEALSVADRTASPDRPVPPGRPELNWQAALQFISRVQNLPGSNDQPWAQTVDQDDRGGFVYSPNESKAGDEPSADGSRRLHSYGSMSYAGLLSFIYADVDRDDPRVTAAMDWIRRHYTVDENPGMGMQGLYYNYHTMSKALAYWGELPLGLPDGRVGWWRKDLAKALIAAQRIDTDSGLGYWVNDNGRWWENDPVLSTCYALRSLEIVLPRDTR